MNDLTPIQASDAGVPENRFIAQPHPFSDRRIDIELPTGMTIAAMLDHVGLKAELRPFAHVWLCDADMRADPVFVPERNWASVRPKPGVTVTLRVAPGGGGGKKSILGIILKIVVIIAAAVASIYGTPALGSAVPLLGCAFIGSSIERKPT